MINEATRVTSDTKALIDHVNTNKPDRVSSSGIISCGISDHDAVYLVRYMRMPKMRREPKTVTVRKFRRFDLDAFKSDLQAWMLSSQISREFISTKLDLCHLTRTKCG